MKETMNTVASGAGVAVPAPGVYEIDTIHSNVTFSARHLMVSKVRGRFTQFTGTIHVEEELEKSWAELNIEARSIDTSMPMRDEHLRSPDFLDVERFPALTFRSNRWERTGENTLKAYGDLTIRDVTRPVALDVEYLGAESDLYGRTVTAFSLTAELDREDFGMTWNKTLESGGVLVGRKVKVEVEVEAARQADATAAA